MTDPEAKAILNSYGARWIPVGGALYQCDQCGVVSLKRKFCSEFGADMREETE